MGSLDYCLFFNWGVPLALAVSLFFTPKDKIFYGFFFFFFFHFGFHLEKKFFMAGGGGLSLPCGESPSAPVKEGRTGEREQKGLSI